MERQTQIERRLSKLSRNVESSVSELVERWLLVSELAELQVFKNNPARKRFQYA